VQAQLEGGDDAEVAAAAAQRPEQVRVLVGAGADLAPVGEDDVGGDEVVDRHPVAPALVRDAAAERQAGHPGLGHDPAGGGEAEGGGDAVDVGPRRAALHVDGAVGVHVDAAHRRQVDHQAVVDHGGAGDVVAAAADGERQPLLPGEADGGRDVAGVDAAGDQRGALVDHAVPHLAGGVVAGMVRGDDLAGQVLGERGVDVGGRGGMDGHGCSLGQVRVQPPPSPSGDRPERRPGSVPRASGAG
jgi:hypothetical protein